MRGSEMEASAHNMRDSDTSRTIREILLAARRDSGVSVLLGWDALSWISVVKWNSQWDETQQGERRGEEATRGSVFE